MSKILNYFISHFKTLIIIYILIQILFLIFSISYIENDIPKYYQYYEIAQNCLSKGTIYPAPMNLYDDFIIAPLYINLIIVVISIYHSVISIGILNIILNILQLYFLYKISKKVFNESVAKITSILYMFYLNSLGMIILDLTEMFFGVLVLSSIYFYLKTEKKYIFISGLLAAASLGVRPIGWALLISIMVIEFYNWINNKIVPKKLLLYLTGVSFFILIFGAITYYNFNYFIFTSVTGGYNLLIGANDLANGGYNDHVFEKGNLGYIPDTAKKTFVEKDKIWRNESIDWINKNKLKWIGFMPLKIIHTYIWDDITLNHILKMPNLNFAAFVKYIIKGRSISNIFHGYSTIRIILYFILEALNLLYYYALLLLIFIGVKSVSKAKMWNPNLLILVVFFFLGLIITMIIFGGARYKYPYIILLLPFAAIAIKSYKRFAFS